MKSTFTWFRTIYVSTIMIVIGLSFIQSPMYTVNGNANKVYGKKYTYDLDATGSSVESYPIIDNAFMSVKVLKYL